MGAPILGGSSLRDRLKDRPPGRAAPAHSASTMRKRHGRAALKLVASPERPHPWWLEEEGWLAPAPFVFRLNEELVVHMGIPGIDPGSELYLALEGGRLVIRGEGEAEGRFKRLIPLRAGTAECDVTASYEDGILEVRVQKASGAARVTGARIPVSQAG
jgi:HSP20 family protein